MKEHFKFLFSFNFPFIKKKKINMKSIVFLGILASVAFAFPAGQKKQFKINVKKSKSNSDMTHSSRVVSYLVKETQTAYNHGSGKLSS